MEQQKKSSLSNTQITAANAGGIGVRAIQLKDNRKNSIVFQKFSKNNISQQYSFKTSEKSTIQKVAFSEAANRAPLSEIRDYESGKPGNRPKISDDKLRDFKKVQEILHHDDTVKKHMGHLNSKIEQIRKTQGNKLTSREALLHILRKAEKKQGYNPKEGIINEDDGTEVGASKLSNFGKAGMSFQDFGVSASQHGPDTHRIQQYILYQENKKRIKDGENTNFENKEGAFGVYKDMANYRYAVHNKDYKLNQHSPNRAGRSKIFAWEMLLDRVNGKQGVDVEDPESMSKGALKPDAGYPIHLMDEMKKGSYGKEISAASLEAVPAYEKHSKNRENLKILKKSGTSLLGGIGIGAIASLGFSLNGPSLLLATGLGLLGGFLYGKKKWK